MSKYKTTTSRETILQAEKLAKGTQRPGQTKEQTKLIAQGIQKGIEQYKKQHKSKARELDKKLKTVKNQSQAAHSKTIESQAKNQQKHDSSRSSKFPWLLLASSWILFILYIYMTSTT